MKNRYMLSMDEDSQGLFINVYKIDLQHKDPNDGPLYVTWSEYASSTLQMDGFTAQAKESYQDFEIVAISQIEVRFW